MQVTAPNEWNTSQLIVLSQAPVGGSRLLRVLLDVRLAVDFLDEPDGPVWFGNEPGHVDVLAGAQWYGNGNLSDPPDLKAETTTGLMCTGVLPMTIREKWVRTDRDVQGISCLWQTEESLENHAERAAPSSSADPTVNAGFLAYFSDSIGTEGDAFLMHAACWLRVLWEFLE